MHDGAQSVNDSAREQPEQESRRGCGKQGTHQENSDPSHPDVQRTREPLWGVHPDDGLKYSHGGKRPDCDEQPDTEPAAQQHQTDGCVRASDEDIDHHVIDAPEVRDSPQRDLERVIKRAGAVHRDEARAKDRERDDLPSASVVDGDDEEDHESDDGEDCTDEVSHAVDGLAERDAKVHAE